MYKQPDDESDGARRYRKYAEQLRVIAGDRTLSPRLREALLEAAVAYDRVAAAIEADERSETTRASHDGGAGQPTSYRCYLFDKFNRIDRAIDIEAYSDADALARVARLHAQFGYLVFELWRGDQLVHPRDDQPETGGS